MLTAEVITAATPLVLGTLVKHYLARRSVTKDSKARDDLIFDEVFVLLKTFMEISSKHTVEDLQRLTLTTAPSPPYVLIHRLLIPLETCQSAAKYLVQGLGGEEKAKEIVGGTKWWQVRGLKGVEAEWIGIKRDWKADEERRKEEEGSKMEEPTGEFAPEMDHLRCMLYIHGGAYYWGSINTHRYSIWRYARKMKGRCFAVNYRKSPQYPFPCAIQDCLAAYLYLLHPPPGAKHRPVDPKNLVIAGDSAGGGLVLALLQIIRDTGLAMPAGAVLISPWSDLTHSFPSILENTATDIVPPYGFIHRPSTLWPPPPPELTQEMQKTMRSRVKEGISRLRSGRHNEASSDGEPVTHNYGNVSLVEASDGIDNPDVDKLKDKTLHPVQDTGDVHHNPGPDAEFHSENPSRADPSLLQAGNDTLELDVKGEKVTIKSQIQLYCTNAQLTHPLVSPALGYLGGLCPLLVIAGDKEVLRDEIIYVAHKAAHPERYPLKDNIRKLQPCLEGIEDRFGPTEVHLQVYDEVCHVLPLLSMTKPARGCYRAIASFARYVTAAAPASRQPSHPKSNSQSSKASSTPNIFGLSITSPPSTYGSQTSTAEIKTSPPSPILTEPPLPVSPPPLSPVESAASSRTMFFTPMATPTASPLERQAHRRQSTFASLATPLSSPAMSRTSSTASIMSSASDDQPAGSDLGASLGDVSSPVEGKTRTPPEREITGDDAGPRFGGDEDQEKRAAPGTAGHPGIYRNASGSPFKDYMIRERVSIDGVCRGLDNEKDISSLHMPLDQIGVIKEAAAMRYVTGQALWDKKYHRDTKRIAKRRAKHLADADNKDANNIRAYWEKKTGSQKGEQKDGLNLEELLFDNNWTWTWAFEGENPPPSCIVSRRDFSEARVLARMADRLDDDAANSHAVNLWVALASFFSSSTMRDKPTETKHPHADKKLAKIEKEEEVIREVAKRRESSATTRPQLDLEVSPDSTPPTSGQNTPSKGGFRKLSSILKGSK